MEVQEIESALFDLSSPDFWMQTLEQRDAAFDRLRREQPVSWQKPPIAFAPQNGIEPRGYWAVTRHADIQTVHRDSKTFIAGKGTFLFDNMSMEDEYAAAGMMGLDGQRHTRLRALVQSTFNPKTLLRSQEIIDRRCQELVSAVAESGQCDYKDIVNPLPSMMIADLLGFPEEDRGEVARLIHMITAGSGPNGFDDSLQASRDLASYAIRLSRERARCPKDDLLTLLVQAEVDGEGFSEVDLGAMVHLIAVAGADTTAGALQQAIVAFDHFPSERARMVNDFDAYIGTAVDEVLRWATPGVYIRRVATKDVVLSGQPIREGDNIVLWARAANRDETVFDDPYRFDVARSPNPHVTFGGGGRHFCLGHELAKMELRSMLRTLFRYIPDIHLTAELSWAPTPQYVIVDGPMPCAFTPTRVEI